MKKAFTLAEVLVTLGIIGVVSAMTVPSLMQNYQRQSYVAQLHKVYNELSQALMNVMTENNALSLTESPLVSDSQSNTTNSEKFIKKYLKVVNDCGTGLNTPCFAKEYKTLKGETTDKSIYSSCYSYVLANGSSICISGFVSSAYVIVDTNGQKGPNIAGRDYWSMSLYSDGVVDAGVNAACRANPDCDMQAARNQYISNCDDAGEAPDGCFEKILNNNWEMNY